MLAAVVRDGEKVNTHVKNVQVLNEEINPIVKLNGTLLCTSVQSNLLVLAHIIKIKIIIKTIKL